MAVMSKTAKKCIIKKISIENSRIEKIFNWLSLCTVVITIFIPLNNIADVPILINILSALVIISSIIFVFLILDIVSIERVVNSSKPSVVYEYRFSCLMLGLIIGVILSGALSIKNIPNGCSVGFCGMGDTITNMMSGFVIIVNFMYLFGCVIADRIYMRSVNDKLLAKK